MMRTLLRVTAIIGVWLSVAAALKGFVEPWAHLDVKYRTVTGAVDQAVQDTPLEELTRQLTKGLSRVVVKVKRGAETITGELSDLSKVPEEVTGAQIPQWANRQDAKVVLALAEIVTGQRQLGAKSYAVYLVPGAALLFGILLTAAGRLRLLCGLIALLCLAAAGGGFWKLLTTDTNTLLVDITIGRGLWMSLWAYAGLGLCALLLALYNARTFTHHRRGSSGSRAHA